MLQLQAGHTEDRIHGTPQVEGQAIVERISLHLHFQDKAIQRYIGKQWLQTDEEELSFERNA